MSKQSATWKPLLCGLRHLGSCTWNWPTEQGEHLHGFKHARKWQPDIFQSSIIEDCSQNGLGCVTTTTWVAIFGQPLESLFTVMAWDIFFLRAKLVPVRTDWRGEKKQLLLAAWLHFFSLAASFIQQLSDYQLWLYIYCIYIYSLYLHPSLHSFTFSSTF